MAYGPPGRASAFYQSGAVSNMRAPLGQRVRGHARARCVCWAMRPGGSDGVCVYVLPRLPAVRSIDHTRHQCKRSNAAPWSDRMYTATGGVLRHRPAAPYRTVDGMFLSERSRYGRIGYNRKALSHIIFFLLSSATSGSSRISCTATA